VNGGLLIVGGDGGVDIRIRHGRVTEMARGLRARANEDVLDARGGAVVRGLHDHHVHLLALVAAERSVPCGPPSVRDRVGLVRALGDAAREASEGAWLRGVGWDESGCRTPRAVCGC
jgi:predicted amidohydrolase YtcJ